MHFAVHINFVIIIIITIITCLPAVSSKQNKMSAESKRNPDLCQHIKNVLAMSTSLEYVHQGSDKPAAKLSMTPCFIAYTRPHCVYAVQEIIMSHVIKSGRKCW